MVEGDRPPQGAKITAHIAAVSDEAQLVKFRDEAVDQHQTDRIHLLFNNAGIGGGGGFVNGSREEWEKTFNVCWGGVYYGTRAFLPMLMRASEGHIINTSSVNGFWASLGPTTPHTAYSAAKFAVKGFTEALVNDLRLNAPHVKCSVVMPGHIGTEIVANSRKVLVGSDDTTLSAEELKQTRARLVTFGMDADKLSDAEVQKMSEEQARRFHDDAPTSAAQAATIILDGVRNETWRILVGDDAHHLDAIVRKAPELAYEPDFFQRFAEDAGWQLGSRPAGRSN